MFCCNFLRKKIYLSWCKLRIKYWQNLGSHLSNKNWQWAACADFNRASSQPLFWWFSLSLPLQFDGFSTSSNKVVKLQVPGAATAREPTRGTPFPLKETPRHKSLTLPTCTNLSVSHWVILIVKKQTKHLVYSKKFCDCRNLKIFSFLSNITKCQRVVKLIISEIIIPIFFKLLTFLEFEMQLFFFLTNK